MKKKGQLKKGDLKPGGRTHILGYRAGGSGARLQEGGQG